MNYALKFQVAVLLASTFCLSNFGLPVKADSLIGNSQAVVAANAEGLLIDPASGVIKGSVDNYGITKDLDGHTISARHFKGFLVVDPVTKSVKGLIGQDEQLIKLDLSLMGAAFTIAKTPSSYIIDPTTGQIKGFIDASGSRFDMSGAILPAVSSNAYAVVNPITGRLEGFINNGQIVSATLDLSNLPDVYRRTTIVTTSRDGQTSQTTTTTTTSSPATVITKFVLPANDTFIAVNPLTGEVKGVIDPATLLVNGAVIPSGFLIVDRSSGLVNAVVSPTGDLVAINLVPLNNTFAASIDSQRIELSRMIANAVSTGQLSARQAAQLQATLDKIPSSVEINKLTYAGVAPIIQLLRSVRGQLVVVANVQPATPIIGWGFITVDGQLKWIDDIAFRRTELNNRIDDEFAAGRINSIQRADLKDQMSRIAALENSYRLHGNGTFTNQESRALYVNYDRLGAKLDHDIALTKRNTVGSR